MLDWLVALLDLYGLWPRERITSCWFGSILTFIIQICEAWTFNQFYHISILTHHVRAPLPLPSFTLSPFISEGRPFSWRHGGGLATCQCFLFCQGTQCWSASNPQSWVKMLRKVAGTTWSNQNNGGQWKIGIFFELHWSFNYVVNLKIQVTQICVSRSVCSEIAFRSLNLSDRKLSI